MENINKCVKNGVEGWKYKEGQCHIGIEALQRAIKDAKADKNKET